MTLRCWIFGQRLFALVGGIALLYTGVSAARAVRFQAASQVLTGGFTPHGPPAEGQIIGELTIPALGISERIVEGISDSSLSVAPGHIPGTALPGEVGNVGIAGHRDTFFRALRRIRANDIVILNTGQREQRYKVVGTEIVPPDDVRPLYPTTHDVLTLVTCYPFYFIGHAPMRFIVSAERLR